MNREVVWTWAAGMDAQEIFSQLEDASTGSGQRFVALMDSLLDLLRKFPLMAPVWKFPLRRARVGKTHYGLFYAVELGRLVIIGLQDLRQDPGRWQREMLRRLP